MAVHDTLFAPKFRGPIGWNSIYSALLQDTSLVWKRMQKWGHGDTLREAVKDYPQLQRLYRQYYQLDSQQFLDIVFNQRPGLPGKNVARGYSSDTLWARLDSFLDSAEYETLRNRLKDKEIFLALDKRDSMYASTDSTYNDRHFQRTRGKRQYQLKNHLGNVLATITDRKLPHNPNPDSLADYYTADIVTADDYYPFGMQMPGRHWTADSSDQYRFGFNGKEKDNSLKGRGNSYNFGARIYDPRVSRFLSVDPKFSKFPDQAPYVAFNDGPILFEDPSGKTGVVSVKKNNQGKTTEITVKADIYLVGATEGQADDLQTKFNQQVANKEMSHDGVKVNFKVNYEALSTPQDKYDRQFNNTLLNEGEEGERAARSNFLRMSNKWSRTEAPNPFKRKKINKVVRNPTGDEGRINDLDDGVHETMHLLGLSDRYEKGEGLNGKFEGFEEDIMAGGDKFSQTHVKNYVEFYKNKSEGNHDLKHMIDKGANQPRPREGGGEYVSDKNNGSDEDN